MRITCTIRDRVGGNFRVEEIKRIEKVSELDIERIARECEKIIGDTIVRKSKHPTGYLASFFYAHPFNNGAEHGWAVVDIAELDKNRGYWNHLDKGSEGIGANWNHWLSKGRWVDGRWVEDEAGYFAKPKTPITALNYISETLAIMQNRIPEILKG